jgi:hypothetical protein
MARTTEEKRAYHRKKALEYYHRMTGEQRAARRERVRELYRQSHPKRPRRQPPRRIPSCHPGKRHYSKNLCRLCYDRQPRIRENHLMRTWGVASAEYVAWLDAQNGVWSICQQPPDHPLAFAVDHDHGSMEIRGLLCKRCNSGLGMFSDNLDLLSRAVSYLSSPPVRGRRAGPRKN